MLYNIMYDYLSKDKGYKGFIRTFKQVQDIYVSNPNVSEKDKEQVELYVNGLQNFYTKNVNDIVQYKSLLAFNYLSFLYKFYKYLNLENQSFEYLSEYRISAIRIMEAGLFMQKFQLRINYLFFNTNEKSFYLNLLNIYEINFNSKDIKQTDNQDTEIIKNNFKIHTDGIYVGGEKKYHYYSTVKMAYGYKKISLASYLRLYEISVHNVYVGKEAIKKEGGSGGGRYIDLVKLDPYPRKLHYENKVVYLWQINDANKDRYNTDYDNDEELESINKSAKNGLKNNNNFPSIKESTDQYNSFVNDSKYKIYTRLNDDKNHYKKFKINTAIGHQSAKSNLSLKSKYTVPKIELLELFIKNIKDKNSYEYKLFISSLLLGIDPKRIIATKLKLTQELDIVYNDTIRVHLSTAYAQITNYEIYKRTKDVVEFALPDFITIFFKESEDVLFSLLQSFIQDYEILRGEDVIQDFEMCKKIKDLHQFMQKNFSEEKIKNIYNTLLEHQQSTISTYITKQRKLFNKTIIITAKNLHTFSFHYYKQFHKESDANLLFLKNKTANIHTHLAYIASTQKLSGMTLWIEELMSILSIDNCYNSKSIPMNLEYSGSNKVVLAGEYKTFLKILMSLKFDNKFTAATVEMIHLRYVLSILLVTRKYYFSANLKQYSQREKLLFLHEKAKNIYTSKRIVPVTELGERYIQYFYKLKEEFLIESNSPVIFAEDGKVLDFDNTNLLNWFEEHK
ncbi:MAG TPA: hypothetical protein ENK75_06000, partial [Saprospiraceae bacterium]|nr:hypothetical protein [Saprospiraceae bacterium]